MEKPLTGNMKTDGSPLTLREYEQTGGYETAAKVLPSMTPKEVQEAVSAGRLRGRGGAGFPTGAKWGFVPLGEKAPHPKFLVANADEMEPLAFKDRILIEGNPHQLIEGMILSAYALEADIGYVFLRHEYGRAGEILKAALGEAYDAGWLGRPIAGTRYKVDIHLHMSAGRYICGEETALLNALEGKRAIPRAKPPFPQVSGLWGKPTIVNNVETLSNVPHILKHGADWFKGLSLTEDGGTKVYTVSGRVKKPGSFELPLGTTIRGLLETHAGGMQEGFAVRAVIPGGGSTEFVLPERFDTPMAFDVMEKQAGSRLGTGTMLVLDNATCPVGAVLNLERFFARESCGWCTPCRDGLPWLASLLADIEEGRGQREDLDVLQEHTWFLKMHHTYCAHAPGAMEPLQSALMLFKTDFERHIEEKSCPYRRRP